jgi:hypothetical protein
MIRAVDILVLLDHTYHAFTISYAVHKQSWQAHVECNEKILLVHDDHARLEQCT